MAERILQGKPACSAKTGSYCKARNRLEQSVLAELTRTVAEALECDSPAWWWGKQKRRIKLIDGSTVSMPDTTENQAAYPQAKTQAPGVGFPLARVVAVISLATGAVMDFAIGPYQGKGTGENFLLQKILHCLRPGDIAVADSYYCSYFLIVMLKNIGVDIVFRLHGSRDYDFRRGKRLGKNDHIVTWKKPVRPSWMDKKTYAKMPANLTVREVRDHRQGDAQDLIVATTLLSAEQYPKQDLIELYGERWCCELDLRSIKSTMQMGVLRCKTPKMVRKEIWAHLLAYNLIRKVIAHAAEKHGLRPRQISFKGALQTINVFLVLAEPQATESFHQQLCDQMLTAIAAHRIGNRPGRREPRAVKRRPKPTPLLKRPRAEARKALL